MSKHTQEPWKYEKELSAGCDEWLISMDAGDRGRGICIAETRPGSVSGGQENARRIVACVNACAGMETEHLENQSMLGETLLDRFNILKIEAGKLTKQRDELLEALEAFSNYIHAEQCSTDGHVHYSDGQLTALAVMARKAIVKAKGGAA